MPRKAFHLGIDIDIHAVTCPGVWLCPKGDAMLQISMLGASAHTKRVEPNFPLLFHERFHFRKTLTGVATLAELQSELSKRVVHLRLVQWQVHGCRCVQLAAFRSPLADLLYPQPASRGLVAGVDVDLLMETSPCFPGIIAPKIEISTKVVIEEMVNYPLHARESAAVVNHKTLSSKRTVLRRADKPETKSKPRACSALCGGPRLRQKPVCHARPRVKCYSCKQRVPRVQKPRLDDTYYVPYCNKCGDIVEEKGVKQGKIIIKESDPHTKKWEQACPCVESPRSKSVCDCSLCRKYHDLFKNSPPSSILSNVPKSPQSKVGRPPSPDKKVKGCACLSDKADGPSRLRAGSTQTKSDCVCLHCPGVNDSSAEIGEYINELLKHRPRNGEYHEMLKADLDTRYKKLYERVSRRSNRRQS